MSKHLQQEIIDLKKINEEILLTFKELNKNIALLSSQSILHETILTSIFNSQPKTIATELKKELADLEKNEPANQDLIDRLKAFSKHRGVDLTD